MFSVSKKFILKCLPLKLFKLWYKQTIKNYMSTYKKKVCIPVAQVKWWYITFFFGEGLSSLNMLNINSWADVAFFLGPKNVKKYIFFLKKNIEIEAINLDIGGNNQPNGMCGSFLQGDPSC